MIRRFLLKYSKQRELILETLKNAETHLTAEEIHLQVRRELPSVSLGTVYRNLSLLVELGHIRTLKAAGSLSVRYDGRTDEHCHLICTKCGKITDIDLDVFTPFDVLVYEKTGFSVDDHDLVLKGVCAECANRKNS
jgi:Fur family peroxide stress response transcriptional regulator